MTDIAQADLDKDGKITNKDLKKLEQLSKITYQDKLQDQQRMMAWVAMGSMLFFVGISLLPIISEERLQTISAFLNTFFVSQAAVVSVFMGTSAYTKVNSRESISSDSLSSEL